MQTIEAIFSLMFFFSIATAVLLAAEPKPIDDSLYRMELANDAWRVLYLRGNFEDFGESKRAAVEKDLETLGDATGLCYFIDGINYTNCRGGNESHEISSLQRTIIDETRLKSVTFSIRK